MYTHVHVHTTAEPASLSSSFARAHVSRRIRISRGRAAWRHRTVPTLRRADLGLELPASSLCAGSQGKAHPSRGAITPSLRGRYFWARLVAPAPRAAAGRVSEVRRVSGAACRASLPSQACRLHLEKRAGDFVGPLAHAEQVSPWREGGGTVIIFGRACHGTLVALWHRHVHALLIMQEYTPSRHPH